MRKESGGKEAFEQANIKHTYVSHFRLALFCGIEKGDWRGSCEDSATSKAAPLIARNLIQRPLSPHTTHHCACV
eukprot:1160813-Pelagomonas_calceolata.AAC.4